MSPPSRLWKFLSVIVALGLLAGCGGGGSDDSPAAGAIDDSAVLRAGWTVGPTSLDPHMATAEVVWFRFGMTSIYDRLFTVNAAGEVEGMLVDSWEYSEDGLQLTMKLREDVTFRDGTPLDAQAVKLSLDRARTLQSPVVKARMAAVTGVEVLAPYEVRLTLPSPTPSVPYILAECAGFIMHPDLVTSGDPATETNGSGAYSVESFTPGESLVLVRDRTDYWDPEAAKIARIEHRAIPEFQAFSNALAAGQIDIGQFQPNNVASIEGRSGLETVPVPQGISSDLLFNRAVAPMDDLKVRQAINLAIDRETITQALYPGSEPKYQYYREGLPGHDPSLGPIGRDVERAKALLAEAGYPNGVDLGEMLVSTAITAGLLDVVLEQLAEVGIRADPVTVDALQIFPRWAEGKSSALLQFSSTGLEPGAGASTSWGLQLNPAGTTPEFDRILAAAADNRLSQEERNAGYRELNRFLREQAWSAPITWINYPWVMTERLQGFSAEMDYATTLGPYDFRYLSMQADT